MSRRFCTLIALCLLACACNSGSAPADDGRVQATTTVGMLASIVEAIGGDRIANQSLMGAGTDPHLYKATPGDVKRLSSSDIIFYCGHHLEGKMGDKLLQIERRIPSYAVCELLPTADLLHEDDSPDTVDPHLWFDVALWARCAAEVQKILVQFDPQHAADYEVRGAAYVAELEALDAWVRQQIATIPAERRVLVTAHDAFRYFGRAYGIEVLAIQGLSTESEASLHKINELVSLIVQRNVPAVFVESTVSEKNVRSLIEGCGARDHELQIGGTLYSDAMGEPGTPGGTYEGMVRSNVEAIVKALR
ncbi:MAG: zinc ABC transporter substrate-binding protein [Planctomycetota bacterium]